jgi:hypothetical protein
VYNALLVDPALPPGDRSAARIKAVTLVPPILPSTVRPHDCSLDVRHWALCSPSPRVQAEIHALRARLSADLSALRRPAPPGVPAEEALGDPLQELGGTAFHLAHQGLNDRDIQVRRAARQARARIIRADPP